MGLFRGSHSNFFRERCPTGIRDDNGVGQVRSMESFPSPCMILSYPIPALPRMMGKIFLLYPCPLSPYKTLPYLVKLYFLSIYPQLLQLFLIKPVLLIKIYLKLQIILFHQIKLIFSKNWIILLKCLIRQYHNKNKNLITQNHLFNSI